MAGRVIDEATRARARASSGKRILGQLANARDALSRVADGQALTPGAFGSRKSTAIGAGVDSALNDALAAMTDTHAQRVAAALAAEVVPWIEEGVRRWPVATGKSKNGLNVSFSNEDGALTVILKGDEPYTYVLRWGSRDPFAQAAEVGKSAWATLFRSQANRISKRIAKRVFGGGNG